MKAMGEVINDMTLRMDEMTRAINDLESRLRSLEWYANDRRDRDSRDREDNARKTGTL